MKANSRPLARLHGRLAPIEEFEPVDGSDTERLVREMLSDPVKLEEFATEHEVDFSYSVSGLARFRVNAFRLA